jgi:hypothetical protein
VDRWQISDRGEIGFYIIHESKEQNAVEFGTYSRAFIARRVSAVAIYEDYFATLVMTALWSNQKLLPGPNVLGLL